MPAGILTRMKYVLRSEAMETAYQAHLAQHASDGTCPLCAEAPLQTFTHWKQITNHFPYDLVADTHHMIVPLRHTDGADLTQEEWIEYQTLKNTVMQEYEEILENTTKSKSIPQHFHVHLLIIQK